MYARSLAFLQITVVTARYIALIRVCIVITPKAGLAILATVEIQDLAMLIQCLGYSAS